MTKLKGAIQRARNHVALLSMAAFLVVVLGLTVVSTSPAPGNPFAPPDSIAAASYKDKKKSKKPDTGFDCAPDPSKWNPYEGAFQRKFYAWCERWVRPDPTKDYPARWERDFHLLTCDQAACSMGVPPSEFCNFSEVGDNIPPEMLTCPGGLPTDGDEGESDDGS